MSNIADPEEPAPERVLVDERRNDPLMTLFVVGVMLLLAVCLLAILIANSRRPAGL